MKNKDPWYISFVTIIIAFLCFWPIGCILLYLRWQKKSGTYTAITRTLIACTIVLILFGIVGISEYYSKNDSSDLILAIFIFIIPGLICGYFALKRTKKLKIYNKYSSYINIRKKVSIDEMCNNLNMPYDTTINILTEMINKKVIDAYIADDKIILNGVYDTNENLTTNPTTKKEETKIVKCPECGAKNTVTVGKTKECEYCGTLLQ